MKLAFVIMQIGNKELDKIYKNVFVPVLKSCGLDPKRVDKHTEGRLLKSEIVKFIEASDIIIADITNERPNCYLEIGYSMGLDKFPNLILTAREDHDNNSPNYKVGGPKIHFDLSGYNILFWDLRNIKKFEEDLKKRIKFRLAILNTLKTKSFYWDNDWISEHQNKALSGLKNCDLSGFMEVRFILPDFHINIGQKELLLVAREAQIKTFGWPIGVVIDNVEEYCPKPKRDGIIAEISIPNENMYDYWSIRRDGAFYLLKSLFEDKSIKESKQIFFDTRIIRITEVLLYSINLYNGFKVPLNSKFLIGIRHGGLKGRVISRANKRFFGYKYKTLEDEVYTEVDITFEEIKSDMINIVQKFSQQLFIIFDFFEIDIGVLENIVNNYVEGRVI